MGTPEEDNNVTELLKDLHQSFPRVQVLSSRLVPWFPRRMSELDSIANNTLDAGAALQSDHPGFSDMAYRASRERIAELARNYKMGEPIPIPTYTTEEHKCWSEVYNKLMPLVETSACSEYRRMIPLLRDNCDFGPDRIPSLQDVSAFLGDSTGFVLRPVAGLLSSRNFLYGLAFRVFFCTQYIRHHSKPLYTPEPDICHELLGHAPLFADKDFAEFSQAIGMASLGATDEQIVALARCYWFSVEFGLCKEKETGDVRAYGAGLLSSFGELEYCMTDEPEKRPFVPDLVGLQDFPITTYQPIYFVADSFTDAKDRMVDYAQGFSRPFNVRYDAYTKSIDIDALIEMDESTKIEESVSY
jgi:phenylalanine-4-hydroxylase